MVIGVDYDLTHTNPRQGGFGKVYKAILSDKSLVAVKHLKDPTQGHPSGDNSWVRTEA